MTATAAVAAAFGAKQLDDDDCQRGKGNFFSLPKAEAI